MRITPLRLLAVAAAMLLLVPATALAGLRDQPIDRGVVQANDGQHLTLRAIDGSAWTFDLFAGTQYRVNGVRAAVTDVTPGLVADVVADGKNRAIVVRAYGSTGAQVTTDRGVVTAVSKVSITIQPDGGGAPVTVPIDRGTKVRIPGALAKKGLPKPGAIVTVTHVPGGPALVITIIKRAGA